MGLRFSQTSNYAKFSPVAVTRNLGITDTATGPFRAHDCQKRARCEHGTLRCRVLLGLFKDTQNRRNHRS
jgi:hypothetical protein